MEEEKKKTAEDAVEIDIIADGDEKKKQDGPKETGEAGPGEDSAKAEAGQDMEPEKEKPDEPGEPEKEKPDEPGEPEGEKTGGPGDQRDVKLAELNDRLMRQMAEFDNFRKRTEKEKAQMFDIGLRSAIEKVLPVADNFERAFKGLTEEQLKDPFIVGMDKVYKQLMTVFESLDIKEIEAEGKEFDPELHNAIMHEDNPDVGENIITEVYQKGYTCHDTVLRHSMVKVAN